MVNTTNRKYYFYSGPVYRFNDIVKKNWTGGTTALTENKHLVILHISAKLLLALSLILVFTLTLST